MREAAILKHDGTAGPEARSRRVRPIPLGALR
jgi:hypothetical protein